MAFDIHPGAEVGAVLKNELNAKSEWNQTACASSEAIYLASQKFADVLRGGGSCLRTTNHPLIASGPSKAATD
jgi:hypothetical protein